MKFQPSFSFLLVKIPETFVGAGTAFFSGSFVYAEPRIKNSVAEATVAM
jgi:hypothetical protein